MRLRFFFALGSALAAVLLAVRCGSVQPLAFDSPGTYYSTMRTMVVEVVYEVGAEPNEGTIGGLGPLGGTDVWSILSDNLTALFANRSVKPTFQIHSSHAQWKSIAAQNQAGWTVQELATVIGANRVGVSTADTSYFTVAFLKGRFEDSNGINNSVLGVNLAGSPFVAVFKDTVEEASSSTDGKKFIEQATLVHELGHALGLVNGGLPMTSNHQDSAHGAHCSNTQCVMYWQNQMKEDVGTFVQNFLNSGETVLYADDCIADVTAYKPSNR